MKTSMMKLFAALVMAAWMTGCASTEGGNLQSHDLVYDPSTTAIG